ncbi:TPA: tyrosine--tRNA ligase, partial [Candidatus Peregrinibacteria bacterium]|nr:tyrosine--tRNA ligase [Candidatus Peregrinibacteria bacterium]
VAVNVRKDLEKKLLSGKKLRIKFGIDPTGSALHLGHSVPLRKLAEFQRLGHHIILLFGTFTGKIGDPTGKDTLRVPLTDADIQKNMETYLLQAGKILDIENIEIVKNGDWLEKLNFADVLQLAGSFTASQMMQRDMFKKRIEQKKDINLVEFFYPLMQGYDSVPIKADVEIGGTDQLFNLMAGRKIQEHFGMPAQNIITVPILEGLDGHEKMSKSLQNYIGILDSYSDIFGKIMSIPDELMEKYFLLLTQKSVEEIAEILTIHPRDAKITLAKIITAELHSQDLADKAEEEFKALFAGTGKNKNAIPDDITEKTIDAGNFDILNIAIQTGLFSTNSEARRKVEEGAFKIDGNKYTNIKEEFQLIAKEEYVMQFGKRHFIKICVK